MCTHDTEFVSVLGGACLQSSREVAAMTSTSPELLPPRLVLQAMLVLLQNPLNGDLRGLGRQLVVQLAQVSL